MAKYQGKLCTYELSIDESKKVFHAQASGFFGLDDGNSFLKDYDQLTRNLPADQYVLIIDAPDLKPSSPEVAALLGSLMSKYIEVPFKSRYLITKGNIISILQFKRIGNDIPGWNEGVKYIDSIEEVLTNI
jgi:hypothetical protein